MHRRFVLIATSIFQPSFAFTTMKERRITVAPVIILLLCTVVVGQLFAPLKQPVVAAAVRERTGMATGLPAGDLGPLITVLSVVFQLFPVLLKCAVIAGWMMSIDLLFRKTKERFSIYFSVAAMADFVLIVKDLATIALLYGKGTVNIRTLWDLHPAMGLDLLIADRANDVILATVAGNLDLFTLWHIAVLSFGWSAISGLPRRTSVSAITVLWLVGIGFQMGMAVLSMEIVKMTGG